MKRFLAVPLFIALFVFPGWLLCYLVAGADTEDVIDWYNNWREGA